MNKLKIHELAKELNVTSKRLMEKLEEINIHPKSHMSTLEDGELDRLYKHIGIVNRTQKKDAPASNKETVKSDRSDNAKRKNTPRIIRKTEVVVHDDMIQDEHKEKKKNDRRSYVRSSDSNDGLMAGYTRGGRDNVIAGIKKRPKREEPKPQPEDKKQEPVDILESIVVSDKIKKPVDDILSIKKVAHVSDLQEKSGDSESHSNVNEQENMQKDKAAPVETKQAEVKTPTSEIPVDGKAEETKVLKAEETKALKADEKQAKKPETLSAKKQSIAENKEAAQKATDGEKVADKAPQDDGEKKKEVKSETKSTEDAGRQTRRQGPSGGTGAYADRRDGDRRPQGDYPRRNEGPRGEWKPREGGQPRGDVRQGDRRPYGDRGTGGRPPYADRGTGGRPPYGDRATGGRPPYGDRGTGGRPPYGDRGAGGRPPYGDRGTGGRPPYGDRGAGGRPPYGDRGPRPYGDRRPDGDNRFSGRRDDRRNGPLVIPKAASPAGQAEEKVFTRGERREMQVVEKKKEEKKEQKKETVRPAATAPQKGRMRKKIDHIVGHTASVSDMMSDDFVINTFYSDPNEAKNVKRAEKRLKKGKNQKAKHIPPRAVLTDITIPESITVKALAEALKKTAADVIKKLFLMGITVTQNEELDFDTATILADEYGVKVHKAVVVSEEDILFDDSEDDEKVQKPRAPVVVVMGHVDHGKTSLLDAIRSANIAEREAGGITQHIGAYTVNLNGKDITFLDTPGHEAFTAMRARGAQVTDIAILVVAADDGVMPQTVEAINHAKAAGVSIIVAINKIDRPNANQDRVKQELSEHGLLIEEWGGDVIAVPVSAKKQENIDQLLEMVLLTADILELKANPDKQAKGTVIEAMLDKNKGPVATLLVQRGTLKTGDFVLSGSVYGHIRSMVSDKGKKITEAGPSVPVEVFGMSEVPEAGELFYAVDDEKTAKQLAERRKEQAREQSIGVRSKVTLEDLFSQIQEGQVKDLNLIVKADVQGSVEAIKQSMEKLSNEEVKVKVIHGGVGAIIEADVTLADVSNAIIIGFNVRPAANVVEAAQAAGVDLRMYRVIYDAIGDIQNAMKGMLKPTYKEMVDGHIEIRQIFKVSSVGTIGGSYVLDGKVTRNSDIRLVRDGIVILEGKLSSLKRFKDDVREVSTGYECGLTIEKYNDIKEGDIIEAFHMEEIQR